MNRGQIRTLAWTWLDDVNGGYFTSDQMNVWINNAQRETQKRLLQAGENWYVTRAETSTVANQFDYALPSDFLKVHRLEIVLSGTSPNEEVSLIEPITINQSDLYPAAPGTPAGYYIKKDRFTLLPAPDTVKTLRLWYSYLVTDLVTDGEEPDVPNQYHEYIAILATLDGLFRDGRDPSPFLEKKRYYEDLMKQDAENRREDQPRSIVVTNSDGFESLF